MNSTSVEITAGLGGFLVLFGLMVVVWFLGRDMTRRLRRMRMAEDQRLEALRREQARERQSGERRTEAVEGRPGPEPDERGAARQSSADDDPIG